MFVFLLEAATWGYGETHGEGTTDFLFYFANFGLYIAAQEYIKSNR